MASDSILHTLISLGAIEQATDPANRNSEDAIAAEAREDLILATTLRTTSILLDQMRGALKREFEAIETSLKLGEFADSMLRLQRLAERAPLGRHLVEPWQVVLAGPPNAGKSSLLNLLLGYSRAIVHEQAGTTRDLLSEQSSFEGWPIELIDGAGIRPANDPIEAIGVERTLMKIHAADCVLLLVDKSTGWTETHAEIFRQCEGHVVLVVTKSDLWKTNGAENQDCYLGIPSNVSDSIAAQAETSSLTGAGLKELIEAVVSALVPFGLTPDEPIPFRQRHRSWIDEHLNLIPASISTQQGLGRERGGNS
jgi:tRNA modification GTPase